MTRGRPKGKGNRKPQSDWARALKARHLTPVEERVLVTDEIVRMRGAGSSWADCVRKVGLSEPTVRRCYNDRIAVMSEEDIEALYDSMPAITEEPKPEPKPEPEPEPAPEEDYGYAVPPVHSGPAEIRPDPEPIDLSDADLSTPEGVTQMMLASLQQLQTLQQRASEDGNHTAAQRALRDIVSLTNTLTRHQKEAASGRDGLYITAEEARDAEQKLTERFNTYAKQRLLCEECGRTIRIELSKPKEEDE